MLLVFGRSGPPGEGSEHAELADRLARHRGTPLARVLLQDRERSAFYRGASGLGNSIDEVVAALRSTIEALAPREVVAFGEGAAGHAALVYGVLLGVDRIVAVEPPAHLIADELALYHDRRWPGELAGLPDPAEARRYDVSALIASLGYRGRAYILYGTGRGHPHADAVHVNAVHAQRLALSGRVTLCPFPEVRQGVLGWLDGRGELEATLSRYLFEAAPAADIPADPHTIDSQKLLNITTKVHNHFEYALVPAGARASDRPAEDADWYAVVGRTEVVGQAAALGHAAAVGHGPMDDDWRAWIAENLMAGGSPASIADTMADHGIDEDEAAREIDEALRSPYFWGAQRLGSRLKKRDWLLATYRKLRRLDPASAAVGRRAGLTRGEFLDHYYAGHRPVILTGLIDDWPALRRWSLDDLARRFGSRAVEVVDDREATAWLRDDLGPLPGYLDDRDRPAGRLRIEPAGSVAPFRHDPANALVAQVLGRSRVKVVPSWDLPLVQNVHDEASSLDARTTPAAPQPPPDEPQILECVLEAGELLFLPVGSWSSFEAIEASATVTYTNLAFDNAFAGEAPSSARR